MTAKRLLTVSAILWVGGAVYYEAPMVGFVAAIWHALTWHLHKIEVKLNKLLEQQQISVTEADYAK